MAEIIHDLAPGAQIMIGYFGFHLPTVTTLDFNAAVSCLAQHNDVVVDDVSWLNTGLYDGSSAVSQNTANSLNAPANPIRADYTSVSNDALAHYEESYLDSASNVTGSGADFWRLHRYQATANTTDGGFQLSCGTSVYCGNDVALAAGKHVRAPAME